MVSRPFVLGYHGCDISVAQKIVSGKDELNPSNKKYDWLGGGSYFWEDSHSRALRWAQDNVGEKIKIPAVLGAIIDLGHCLNLIDAEHLDLVCAAHKAYLQLCKSSGSTPAINTGRDFRARHLDKAVFEVLHNLRRINKEQPFDTVRAFFVEGTPLYENSGIRALDHIQICVCNPRKIMGYFLPRI
jgi:hypothetical protein